MWKITRSESPLLQVWNFPYFFLAGSLSPSVNFFIIFQSSSLLYFTVFSVSNEKKWCSIYYSFILVMLFINMQLIHQINWKCKTNELFQGIIHSFVRTTLFISHGSLHKIINHVYSFKVLHWNWTETEQNSCGHFLMSCQ